MWLANGDSITTANLWWFLGTLSVAVITAASGIVLALIARHREKAAKSETARAVDEMAATIQRLIIKPLQKERDDYRDRWTACEEGRRHRD